MSWEFKVGMKVVCVDDSTRDVFFSACDGRWMPLKGSIYTIVCLREFRKGPRAGALGAELAEQPITDGKRGVWAVDRFRPLVSKPEAIEQFREIARGVSNGNPIIDDPIPTTRVLEEMTP